jgi:WD repeat-containing protein 44
MSGDREAFFHCLDRVPSGLHLDADFPSDEDDDDDDDVRVSFSSAMGDQNMQSFRRYQAAVLEEDEEEESEAEDPTKYDMWMSDDMSIQERRRRLHQGLGMASSRDLALRRHSMKKRPADVPRSVSRRQPPLSPTPTASAEAPPPITAASPAPAAAAALQPARAITRRHSDSSLAPRDGTGKPPSQPLRRVRSLPARHAACDSAPAEKAAQAAATARELPVVPLPASSVDKRCEGEGDGKNGEGGTKNQSSGKEVAATASKGDASSTATQSSGVPGLDEIEKFIGNTPIMKHLVRRGPSQHQHAPPLSGASPKDDKSAGKKKGGWLKNIKSVAIGFIQDKDTSNAKSSATSSSATTTAAAPKPATANTASASAASAPASASSSERLKAHQSGKTSKELTGLYMCQVLMGG